MKIIKSKQDSTCRVIYTIDKFHYYSVVYLNSNKEDGEYITICISSQIGCKQNCLFCATGNYECIRNLNDSQICGEIIDGIDIMSKEIAQRDIDSLHIIIEGMGEVAHNFDTCMQAFDLAWHAKLKNFRKVVLRISTVGIQGFSQKYKQFILNNVYPNVSYQIKLSLHSPFEEERSYLLAYRTVKSIREIVNEFCELAEVCKYPLICNYLLLQFPNGKINYDIEHCNAVIELLKGKRIILLLGNYSETGRGFSSPNSEVFCLWKSTMSSYGIETYITQLKGADINAACGMLHYGN